jgi:SAM-dependent methyltransferase
VSITGERASTDAGGFNPSFQRHRANYALAAGFLGPGPVLDLGCGVGHSVDLLAPRESVGVDRDPAVLADQARQTVVADMRALPLADGSFASVICSHALEHVPDPERVLAEVARVLASDGVAVFTTPNRLTFGRPDEVIDPYHYLEWSPPELGGLCARTFDEVELYGVLGSERYLRVVAEERRKLEALLRKDPLRLRRLLPRRLRQRLYDRRLRRERQTAGPDAAAVTLRDFELRADGLDEAVDLLAVCRAPRGSGI